MAREKQYVFSARTTEEGLKRLGELRQECRVGWDELVIEAVSAHYNLDKAMMTLPKKEVPAKPVKGEAEQPPAEEVAPEQPAATEQERPSKKQKKGGKKANKTEDNQ